MQEPTRQGQELLSAVTHTTGISEPLLKALPNDLGKESEACLVTVWARTGKKTKASVSLPTLPIVFQCVKKVKEARKHPCVDLAVR